VAKYCVGWTYEEGGYCTVEAKSAKEAKRKVFEHLAEEGNNFEFTFENFDIAHRDYDTVDCEKIDA